MQKKRGKGPKPWRVKYKLPDGQETSDSGFETKKEALEFGRDQEAKIRSGTWIDQRAGEITLNEWTDEWMPLQDVGVSTIASREYLIRRFIRPRLGPRPIASLTSEDITRWERDIPGRFGVDRSTAKNARAVLCTILGDAATAKPPRIPFNPALRQRNRGRRTGRMIDRSPQRTWATPLEALLIGERAALLSGADDDFVLIQTLAYAGMRWGEAIGLERDYVKPRLINVEWQLRELGRFHRLPPKDDSYRSQLWGTVPIDLPPFLDELLTRQMRQAARRCPCATKHGGRRLYVFTGPNGGHYRRGRYAELIFRPACDGRVQSTSSRPAKSVIIDASAPWPGIPVARWPVAEDNVPYVPPSGRGIPRLVSSDGLGRCPDCHRAVPTRLDGHTTRHKVGTECCPGSGMPSAADPNLACWLPVKQAVTPHGLRHSHRTWMAEDAIPDVLAEQRLGHQVPGVRGTYLHVSDLMRQELTAALQERWEDALRARAAISPHSPVPLVDELLLPYRTEGARPITALADAQVHDHTSAKLISQISPKSPGNLIQRAG